MQALISTVSYHGITVAMKHDLAAQYELPVHDQQSFSSVEGE